MIAGIINLFYPGFCRACDTKIRPNQNICEDCLKKIKKRFPPFCIKCGRQIPGATLPGKGCSGCKESGFSFDRAFSAFCYDGVLKKLVHDFKYKKLTSLATEFAELTVKFIKEHSIAENSELLVSVPMHPRRLLKREINPSHILANKIAKKLGIRYSGNLLKKTKNTPPQSKLKRNERINNVKKSFALRKNKISDVQYKNILLVDDIFTTGSTVNECARVLKESGSRCVDVITLARGDRPL